MYYLRDIVGHGHFGNVRLATVCQPLSPTRSSAGPPNYYAIKSIPKSKINQDLKMLKRELGLLLMTDHPNIIKFHEVYEDDKFLHIVMQYCSGGELFDHLVNKGSYSEAEAANVMYKLFSAIAHLHRIKICHRDLKPENLILESKEDNSEIKIVDFGLASKFGNEDPLTTLVGTPYYVAPEVLRRKYG